MSSVGGIGSSPESRAAYERAIGKRIRSVTLDNHANGENGALVFVFDDGYAMQLMDASQDCCENRYMTCDDDLAYHSGATFIRAETSDGPDLGTDEDDCHEVQFLRVTTSVGVIVAETHNEHNGYYGGFDVVAEEL